MVNLVINLRSIDTNKIKRHAPVAADLHRPGAFPWAVQFMKVQGGQVHISRIGRGVQPAENQPQPVCMSRLDATPTARGEETLQTLVPK